MNRRCCGRFASAAVPSLAKNARSARVIAKIVSAPSCAWRITTPSLGRPLFSGRLQRRFHPPLRGGGPPTIGDVLAPLEEGFNQFALPTLRRKRQPLLRLFLRLRPRTAGILDLVEAVASTRPLLTSSSENTFPLLASDRATRMIFAKSGLRLRATDSLSMPLKDIRAATGLSFEVMTMVSESSSAV